MRVVVLVPYRPHPDLAPLWDELHSWWGKHHPSWPLVVADSTGSWSRAEAINRAAEQQPWDVAVIADVCVWQRPETLRRHVDAVARSPKMVIPYEVCVRLNADGTKTFLNRGGRGNFIGWETHRVEDVRQPHGGITVIHRHTWETVGGMDPRFRIWGGEDDALVLSARTLTTVHRGDGVLWQLHHPSMPRDPKKRPQTLAERYRAAKGDPNAVRALIAEREGL